MSICHFESSESEDEKSSEAYINPQMMGSDSL